jgi:hypothetical protein
MGSVATKLGQDAIFQARDFLHEVNGCLATRHRGGHVQRSVRKVGSQK